MPFRRKCEDELPVVRIKRREWDYHRGPLGHVLTWIAGHRPDAVVPFIHFDLAGEERHAEAKRRRKEIEKAKLAFPADARLDAQRPALLQAAEEWWEVVR